VAFEAQLFLNQVTLVGRTRAYRIASKVDADNAGQPIIGPGPVRIVAVYALDRAPWRLLRIHDGMVKDFGGVDALVEIGPDIGLPRAAVMAGIAKVFGVVRVAAVAGQVILFHPQPRVIAAGLIVVGPTVWPVAIDAEPLLVGAVRRKTRTILAAGPQCAAAGIKVTAVAGIAQRVATETDRAQALVEQVTVAVATVGATRVGVMRGMTSHAGDLRVSVQG